MDDLDDDRRSEAERSRRTEAAAPGDLPGDADLATRAAALGEVAAQGDSAAPGEAAPAGDPPPSWLTVLTTEHYNLQTQRAATISETNGRASIFLGAVSAGLIGLGFSIQPGPPTVGFIAFASIVLVTLVFLGLVTFVRTVQTSIDDATYATHIELIRDDYAALLPELAPTLAKIRSRDSYFDSAERGRFQKLVGVSGSLAAITAILCGGAAGLLTYGLSSLVVLAIIVGALIGGVALLVLLDFQTRTWRRSGILAGPAAGLPR